MIIIFRKGQFAIEYIIVSAFAMLILLGSISVIYTQYSNTRKESSEDQLGKITREIALSVNKVYSMGEPAKITLELNFPDNIKDICIGGVNSAPPPNIPCSDKDTVFVLNSGNEIAKSVDNVVFMDKSHKINLNKGIHQVIIEATDNLPVCKIDLVTQCKQLGCNPNTEPLAGCDNPLSGVIIYQK